MTWPLEPQGVVKFAEGLDLVLVIEEKRSLIETQVKEQLYDLPNRPRVLGKKDENEQWLFPAKYALDPSDIAIKVGERLIRNGAGDDIKERVAELKRLKGNQPMSAEAATRIPYFCPGCPHNSSTVVPAGLARLCRHRLPLHGALDGPQHGRVHPDGRGGHQLDRRGALLQDPARVPEPRRRHLHPFGQPGDPRGAGGRRQHDLQDPLQRRRGHDRRPVARRRHDRADDRRPGAGRGHREGRRRHRRAAQVSLRRHPAGRAGVPPPRAAEPAEAAARGAGRLRAGLRPDLRGREAAPAQARPVPRSRQARVHQPGRVRGLRRLRRQVELRRRPPARDRARHQARHRPVGLQQGLLLPQRLLPELRHGARRQGEEGQQVRRRQRHRQHAGEPARADAAGASMRPTPCWSRASAAPAW